MPPQRGKRTPQDHSEEQRDENKCQLGKISGGSMNVGHEPATQPHETVGFDDFLTRLLDLVDRNHAEESVYGTATQNTD